MFLRTIGFTTTSFGNFRKTDQQLGWPGDSQRESGQIRANRFTESPIFITCKRFVRIASNVRFAIFSPPKRDSQNRGSVREPWNDSRNQAIYLRESANRLARIGPSKINSSVPGLSCDFLKILCFLLPTRAWATKAQKQLFDPTQSGTISAQCSCWVVLLSPELWKSCPPQRPPNAWELNLTQKKPRKKVLGILGKQFNVCATFHRKPTFEVSFELLSQNPQNLLSGFGWDLPLRQNYYMINSSQFYNVNIHYIIGQNNSNIIISSDVWTVCFVRTQ